jgi:hypothetical protein
MYCSSYLSKKINKYIKIQENDELNMGPKKKLKKLVKKIYSPNVK